MPHGKRWTVHDRYGNSVFLIEERWEHIVAHENHPELREYEQHLRETILSGIRKQDSLNPRKYRYSKAFDDLPEDNTHIVAIVVFGYVETGTGRPEPNNYSVTAYMKEID